MSRIGAVCAPRATGWAAAAAALLGAAQLCVALPGYDFNSFLAAFASALLIAFAHAGLVAPQVARPLIATRLVSWPNAMATGVTTAVGPTALFVTVQLPFFVYEGAVMPIRDWLAALGMLAVSGAGAGAAFRTLYGPRRLPERVR